MKIKAIAACGNGMGSSQMIKMKINKVFKRLGIDAEIGHMKISLRAEYAPINIVLALILNMVWVFIVLKLTDRIERMLGKGGIYVIRKFFGIILLAISARLFTANITSLIEQFQALK